MLNFTSDVTVVVHGATGSTIKINAGEHKQIPEKFKDSALKAGAYLVGEQKVDQQPTDSINVIRQAIEALHAAGDVKNFDRSGKPKLAPLSKLVGFKVSTAMRDVALIAE